MNMTRIDKVQVDDAAKAEIQCAVISANSTSNTLVAATSGKSICVLSIYARCATGDVLTFKSGSTSITGAMTLQANGEYNPSAPKGFLFETALGEALNLTLGTGNLVAGHLTYVLR